MSSLRRIASSITGGIGLFLLTPMLLILATMVALHFRSFSVVSRQPILSDDLTTRCYQFRTSDGNQTSGYLGLFMKQTSLYMLPGLINVALGEIDFKTFCANHIH